MRLPPDAPARLTLEAWRRVFPDVWPPTIIDSLLAREGATTAARLLTLEEAAQRAGRPPGTHGTLLAPQLCPNCQEVDTERAGTVLAGEYQIGGVGGRPPAGRVGWRPEAVRSSSSTAGGTRETEGCALAVRELRSVLRDGQDRIRGFRAVCLGQRGDDSFEEMSDEVRATATLCAVSYDRYVAQCLNRARGEQDAALLARTGILVRDVPGMPLEFRCTAFRLDAWTIVTARHCLAIEGLVPPGATQPPTGRTLSFIPYMLAESVARVASEGPAGLPVLDELLSGGDAKPLAYVDTLPPLRRDVVLLRLGPGAPELTAIDRGEPAPILFTDAVEKGLPLTLIGFQDFARRLHLLKERAAGRPVPTDQALILSGAWRSFMFVQRGDTCRAVPDGTGGLEHSCQTFGGTSGAPLLAFPAPARDTMSPSSPSRPRLVGPSVQFVAVQASGDADVEGARPPNNAAVVSIAGLPVLARGGQREEWPIPRLPVVLSPARTVEELARLGQAGVPLRRAPIPDGGSRRFGAFLAIERAGERSLLTLLPDPAEPSDTAAVVTLGLEIGHERDIDPPPDRMVSAQPERSVVFAYATQPLVIEQRAGVLSGLQVLIPAEYLRGANWRLEAVMTITRSGTSTVLTSGDLLPKLRN